MRSRTTCTLANNPPPYKHMLGVNKQENTIFAHCSALPDMHSNINWEFVTPSNRDCKEWQRTVQDVGCIQTGVAYATYRVSPAQENATKNQAPSLVHEVHCDSRGMN